MIFPPNFIAFTMKFFIHVESVKSSIQMYIHLSSSKNYKTAQHRKQQKLFQNIFHAESFVIKLFEILPRRACEALS